MHLSSTPRLGQARPEMHHANWSLAGLCKANKSTFCKKPKQTTPFGWRMWSGDHDKPIVHADTSLGNVNIGIHQQSLCNKHNPDIYSSSFFKNRSAVTVTEHISATLFNARRRMSGKFRWNQNVISFVLIMDLFHPDKHNGEHFRETMSCYIPTWEYRMHGKRYGSC